MSRKSIKELLKNAAGQLFTNYLRWVVLVLVLLFLGSGFYNIDRNSVGVLMRFGKVVPPEIPPGLHYKIPWIDQVIALPVKEIRTVEINDFTFSESGNEGRKRNEFFNKTGLDPYFITGDNNILSTKLTIKYVISDPIHYLFNNVSSKDVLINSTSASIIKHVSKTPVDELLTIGRKQLELDVRNDVSKELEFFNTGLSIVFIEIQEIAPPARVQSVFENVINAKVDMKKTVNDAQSYYNRVVPKARSDANRIVQEAESYKNNRITQAEGRAEAFNNKMEEMKKDKRNNRKKLYVEFVKRLFPSFDEIRIIKNDGNSKNRKIIIQGRN
jgi:modulator of FtsH protease HflK